MAMTKCPKCCSSNIDKGKLCSRVSVGTPTKVMSAFYYLSLKNDDTFQMIGNMLSNSIAWVMTDVCLDCGHFENYVDVEKIKK